MMVNQARSNKSTEVESALIHQAKQSQENFLIIGFQSFHGWFTM